jgi:hypothetical protein
MLEPVAKSIVDRLAEIVDEWHFSHFHGSAVARDTEAWNLLYAAKEVLKLKLAEAVTKVTEAAS